jgi:class 3 adenylate cyclase
MFCDIVGSTGLAAQLDPEDLRDIMHAYNRCVAEVVRRYEGHVAKYMGDGVLAYFGYPRAHEDEAERAVRAGLEIVAALRSLRPSDIAFQVRVGIATGLVVVGDLIGEGAAREETVVGETPNLAACLAACLTWQISAPLNSKGSPSQWRHGGCSAPAAPKAGLKPSTPQA